MRNANRKLQQSVGVALAFVSSLAVIACSAGEDCAGTSADARDATKMTAAEMGAATEVMLATPDVRDRLREMIRLADGLTEDNLPGAITAYERDLARIDPHEVRIFANAWAQLDPQGAVDRIVAEWKYPKASFESVEEVVLVWARDGDATAARAYVDPAMKAAQAGGVQSHNKYLVLAVLKALASTKKYGELTTLFGSFAEDANRDIWLTQVMIVMNRAAGWQATREWVDTIPWEAPNDLKLGAFRRALDWTAKLNSASAAMWYEQVESENPTGAVAALEAVVTSWGVYESPAALEWLLKRSKSIERDTLIRQVAFGWLSRKPDEASAWIESSLDREVLRERTLPLLVNHTLKQHQFERALSLAKGIVNDSERSGAQVAIYSEWLRSDESTAKEAMESAQLSDELQREIEERLRNGGKVRRLRRSQQTHSVTLERAR